MVVSLGKLFGGRSKALLVLLLLIVVPRYSCYVMAIVAMSPHASLIILLSMVHLYVMASTVILYMEVILFI